MTYNVKQRAYEKKVWMKVGSQFKFIVNKENKVSTHYPIIYVDFILYSRIPKDFKIMFTMVKKYLSLI